MELRRAIGRAAVVMHIKGRAGRSKLFTVMARGAFAHIGSRTVLELPIRLSGESGIAIGDDVYVGFGSWLQTLEPPPGAPVRTAGGKPILEIGDGTSIAGGCTISAAVSVRLGERVLLARNVYIADHAHAFGDVHRAVLDQGIDRIEPVSIEDGAWLGENVVVCPGVRIGRGSVVGANAVVLTDIPDHAVAVGVPARVVRRVAPAVELAQ
jgi:acetyltransferase-like isoleucine patch superfamily enzyme